MAVISTEDLRVYLNLSALSAGQTLAASAIIDGLEADLEAYLKRPLVETTVEDEVVTMDRRGTIRLRETPVRSVTVFSVDGTAQDASTYEVVSWGLKDVFPGFMPSPLISPAPVLLATYVAGLDGEDPTSVFGRQARGVLLRVAAREFNRAVRQDAEGLERLSVEGTSMSFVNPGGGLSEEDLAKFTRWKKRVVRT